MFHGSHSALQIHGSLCDIVVAPSSERARTPATERFQVEMSELVYSLRSIAYNAHWLRRVFVLVNGHGPVPAWFPEPGKTTVVDQCALLPAGDCPTRNPWAVESVVTDDKARRGSRLDQWRAWRSLQSMFALEGNTCQC